MRMRVLRAVPAVLAFFVFVAHLLREGRPWLVALPLAAAVLCFVPRSWAVWTAKVLLALVALEWVRTLVVLAQWRISAGEPYLRMALILGGVALFTAWAAWLVKGARE
jgi:hypothetical protein